MGARPVKNSVWYELGVATYFLTQKIKIDDCFLDLENAQANPNHRPYYQTKDETGYLSEIDVTIVKINWQYNISCKFSEQEAVLKLESREFLKAILELMSLHLIEKNYREVQMRYLLVTNLRVSTEVYSKNQLNEAQINALSQRLIDFGIQSGVNLKKEQFSVDKLRAFLPLMIVFPITTAQIDTLLEDSNFAQVYRNIAKSLVNIPQKGLSLNQFVRPDLTFFCELQDHSNCYDLLVQRKLCHIGSLEKIQQKIEEILEKRDQSQLIIQMENEELDISSSKVCSSEVTAPETIAHILTSIMNNKELLSNKANRSFYVLPAIFTVFAIDTNALAKKLEGTAVNHRLFPCKLPEIVCLDIGFKAIQEIVQLAYLKGFGYRLPKSEIIFDNDNS